MQNSNLELLSHLFGLDINDLFPFSGNSFREISYPKYNVIQHDEDNVSFEIAVAGFSKDDIVVETKEETIVIVAKKESNEKEDDKNYRIRNIAQRSFKLNLPLQNYCVVKDVTLDLGILTINIQRKLPEKLKPKRIEIKSA